MDKHLINNVDLFYKLATKKYYIDDSNIHGKGIFAGKDLDIDEDIGHLVNIVDDSARHINNEYFRSKVSESMDTFIERSELEKYLNHSSKPNATCKINGSELRLIAIKNIRQGEEITTDYHDAYEKLDQAQINFRK